MLGSLVLMGFVIWASQIYLTRLFTEDLRADAIRRATLYAGAIQSSIQRNAVVPLLLARDPILMVALRSGQVSAAEERLASFREEIGAASIFLLDPVGRIVAASDPGPREQYDGDKAYFTLAMGATGTEFSMVENAEGQYSFHYTRARCPWTSRPSALWWSRWTSLPTRRAGAGPAPALR